jgi:hypothetical protein
MNLSNAIQSILSDRDYLTKLAVAAAVTGFAFLFTPFLIGLFGWAILLGYLVEIVRNTRAEVTPALPRWTDLMHFMRPGWLVLVAFVIYNVPNLFFACSWAFISGVSGGTQIVGSTVMLASICCLLPILLIYNVVMLPFFALGTARFADEPTLGSYFAFGQLYEEITGHFSITFQYVVFAGGALVILSLLLLIPIIGWVLFAALLIPVNGVFSGQYARLVLGRKAMNPPMKPRPQAPPPVQRPRR